MTMAIHPDFDIPWCKKLILDSNNLFVERLTQRPDPLNDNGVSNSMFSQTLNTPHAIRAQLNFKRPAREFDAVMPWEFCFLLSLGSGVDGKSGRAHGGFNALIFDQMTGSVAAMASGSVAPATATMAVDYKAPIDTPGVVLCRGWAVERQGRKTWVKARIEDGQGKLLASAKALFIDPRPPKI